MRPSPPRPRRGAGPSHTLLPSQGLPMVDRPSKDLLETAASVGGLTIFARALAAAGLAEALGFAGPFTVFAPTDDGFAKLPAGVLDKLLRDRERLVATLAYHIAPGRLMAVDLASVRSARTLRGRSLSTRC